MASFARREAELLPYLMETAQHLFAPDQKSLWQQKHQKWAQLLRCAVFTKKKRKKACYFHFAYCLVEITWQNRDSIVNITSAEKNRHGNTRIHLGKCKAGGPVAA